MSQSEFIKVLNTSQLCNPDSQICKFTYCFTDLFCNKSFCRTLSNDKTNVLCKKNASSFDIVNSVLDTVGKCEIDYLTLAERVQSNIWKICLDLKENFLRHYKDDFQTFFKTLKDTVNRNSHVDVKDIVKNIICVLEKVVPCEIYGCRKNKKEFYNCVSFVLNGMSGQHITIEQMLNKWDIEKISWLDAVPLMDYKILALSKLVVFLIKNIVCPIIAVTFYVTTTQLSHETRKLYYYFKRDWQKMSDIYISGLLTKGDIVKYNHLSVGRKCKKNITLDRRKKNKSFMKSLPVMRLMFKTNSSIRVIIKYKKKTSLEKKNEKMRRAFFKTIMNSKNSSANIKEKYLLLLKNWIESGKQKLYFVKADLKDAFGSVDINTLISILAKLHTNYQNVEKHEAKKQIIAKEYHKLIEELNNPVLVRRGSCTYEWKRGLVQGMKYSPILCEIYYKEMDEKYLSSFFSESESEVKFFIRLVDDYLFITDNIDVAHSFIEHVGKHIKINPRKTKINFAHEIGELVERITFFGYVINTNTLEIMRDDTVYSGQIKYRIVFNQAISKPFLFLEKRITQTTVPLTILFLSLQVNSEETVWQNVFISLCISANKFCTIIPLICCDNVNFNVETVFDVYKKKVAVRMCDVIVKLIRENMPCDKSFHYCINHFRYIAYKALSLFAVKTNICMKLLPQINSALKKTNCMEGTWKPHYGHIERNGSCYMALRDICRKYDTKRIISKFTNIPQGFETYAR